MRLKVLGSNSEGNCYLLESVKDTLIVEAGVPISLIRKSLQGGFNRVAGAIVSHRHGDHAKSVRDLLNSGIHVLGPKDVFVWLGAESDTCTKPIESGKGYILGSFKIVPFEVKHDVPCFGYIISQDEMGKLLFVTDTMNISQRMPKHLSQIMIETNYSDDILDKNIESGEMPLAMRRRLMMSHMELGTAKKLLSRMDLEDVQNIVLIHLSSANSDERRFAEEIARHTNRPVYVADTGREFNLSIVPY